jgi:DME family drug/metabolite transporter
VRPVLLVLAASLCFGTTGTALALAGSADPIAFGAVRVALGGTVLALVALLLARRSSRAPRAPRARVAAPVVVLGALGVVAYQPAFFTGTSTNGVALGTIVALGSAPVLTGLAQWVLTRRFPGPSWAVATLLALVGLALLTGAGGAGVGGVHPLGVLSSLGAGAAYAVYTLVSKRLLDAGWSPPEAMGLLFGLAALGGVALLVLVARTSDLAWLGLSRGLGAAVWAALVTIVLAYLLFARGLERLPGSRVATLTLAEPLTATILGVAVLGERLGAVEIAGLAVLAAGLAVLLPAVAGRIDRMLEPSAPA